MFSKEKPRRSRCLLNVFGVDVPSSCAAIGMIASLCARGLVYPSVVICGHGWKPLPLLPSVGESIVDECERERNRAIGEVDMVAEYHNISFSQPPSIMTHYLCQSQSPQHN